MIASAKTSYDTQDAHFRQFSANVILTDQLLAQYGPEAIGVRKLMRQAVPAALDRIWPEKATAHRKTPRLRPSSVAEQIYDAIEALSPANDAQRMLKPRIVQASSEIAHARLLMFADVDTPIQRPFLLIAGVLADGDLRQFQPVRRAGPGGRGRAAGFCAVGRRARCSWSPIWASRSPA